DQLGHRYRERPDIGAHVDRHVTGLQDLAEDLDFTLAVLAVGGEREPDQLVLVEDVKDAVPRLHGGRLKRRLVEHSSTPWPPSRRLRNAQARCQYALAVP